MSRVKPAMEPRRKSSTLHYQTFPTPPPANRGQPLSNSPPAHDDADSGSSRDETALPTKQLLVLAVIALAEQTALNSISPYLPEMAQTFPEVKPGQAGVYVGLIASSFALAQFATNFYWGSLSDRIGRKPVILTGTFLTMLCFVAFGFCRTLWQAVAVQALMGLVNGNAGVVSTCLGEITDKSNQSRAFTYLPVVYGIGAITGPIVGGLLVSYKKPFGHGEENPLPYLLPNLFSAVVLAVDLVICMLFLDESLRDKDDKRLPPLGKRVGNLFARMWQFTSSSRPTYLRTALKAPHHPHHHLGHEPLDGVEEASDEDASEAESEDSEGGAIHQLHKKDVFNRDTVLLLGTYFIFQLANISYNSLYPIFAEEPEPTGRALKPEAVGLSLAFAGAITIVFQIFIYGRVREKIGNKVTYRFSLVAFVVAFALMPFVGYQEDSPPFGIGSGRGWLWFELGFVLVIKTVASVGGLTSALLLVTNSAPDNQSLGALNGLAQTLSAAGRAVGPFISGGLFTTATSIKPMGEALPFGIFAAVAFIGFLLSFGIRGVNLEAEGWSSGDEESEEDEEENVGHQEAESSDERTRLLRT